VIELVVAGYQPDGSGLFIGSHKLFPTVWFAAVMIRVLP